MALRPFWPLCGLSCVFLPPYATLRLAIGTIKGMKKPQLLSNPLSTDVLIFMGENRTCTYVKKCLLEVFSYGMLFLLFMREQKIYIFEFTSQLFIDQFLTESLYCLCYLYKNDNINSGGHNFFRRQ